MNYIPNLCHFLLLKLLVIFITCEGAQNPHGIVLNEVFTFGQQRNFFTNKKPYIELSRARSQEVTLDKYSLVVQICSNWFKLVQTGSNLFKPFQTGSNRFKSVKIRLNWFKLDQKGSG